MINIADLLFPNLTAMWLHLADLCPPQQWMMELFPAPTAIMQQIANLYPHMQMQGHAPPWYPLQGIPPVGYNWEGYPPRYSGVLLPQAHRPEGYPNDVYPSPQLQFSEFHFSESLVVNYPPEGYPNDVYPPPQQQFNGLHFSPPVGYLNNVYPPPSQQFNELHFFEVTNHQPQNTYTQIGGDQNNPQIQGVGKFANKGDLNVGYSSAATNNFNNQGSYAEKQIQGVNGGSVQMLP